MKVIMLVNVMSKRKLRNMLNIEEFRCHIEININLYSRNHQATNEFGFVTCAGL